jgi:hypothetical protein
MGFARWRFFVLVDSFDQKLETGNQKLRKRAQPRATGKRKAPRQTCAGPSILPGCLAVFYVEQVTFKSPRRWFLKEQSKKPCAKPAQGFENSPAV